MTKTAGGRFGHIERGPAMERHLVRSIDNDDGLDSHVVCAFSSGHVAISAADGEVEEVLRRISEHGAEPTFGLDGGVYYDGDVAVDAVF